MFEPKRGSPVEILHIGADQLGEKMSWRYGALGEFIQLCHQAIFFFLVFKRFLAMKPRLYITKVLLALFLLLWGRYGLGYGPQAGRRSLEGDRGSRQ